ncbi:MAG: repair protein RecO [Pseudomonadota bacterium]|jgi:DNA repair protein RecO (recombination protein O)
MAVRRMGARSRLATLRHTTLAFVLRRTPYGDSDLVVGLFSEKLGQLSALARAARKSQRRFGGSLEPFHTIELELDEAPGAELLHLREARIVTPRAGLLTELASMEAAGMFLGWVRHSAPAHTREPAIWSLLESCLDELEARAVLGAARATAPSARCTLAAHGLWLLGACGWRLELEHCVESGERCPEGKAALIDPARGGLVSRARGGAGLRLSGAARRRLIETQAQHVRVLQESDVDITLQLVEGSLRAHAGLTA